MVLLLLVVAIFSALALAGCGSSDSTALTVSNVDFVGMSAPSTNEERAKTYTAASVTVTYSDGSVKTFPLSYKTLYYNTDVINGVTPGAVYDVNGNALKELNGTPYISATPDANSLMQIPGAQATGKGGNPLYMVTHFEYIWLDSSGNDMYGKLPMTMALAAIDQDKADGALSMGMLKNIDMSGVYGLWIPCAGSLSPWNTHLGSEEYEPDARKAETDVTVLAPMNTYYGNTTAARAYNYGVSPEVTVKADGTATVVKHYSMGRISRELNQVMPDNRTVYMGDDGTNVGLFMYIADKEKDLSAGTLYAARWTQTGSANAGTANLTWIRLGHAADAEIKNLANTLKFSDIFETAEADTQGFTKIRANGTTDERLKLKTGMEKAAAFLETRRYAAYLGATTEFNKMEGVTLNVKDKKVYIAMSYVDKGMKTDATAPTDHIQVPKLSAGAIYELTLDKGRTDTAGNAISSDYAAATMAGLVLGEDIAADEVGNTANPDKIANPDNLKFSEKMRTLFIGEDSGMHVNNFLWAYNVDTKKLSRLMSLVSGAESTGLQVLDDLNGFAYIMSNYQHAGDYISTINAKIKAGLDALIDKKKAQVGYISGLPPLK